MYTATVGIPASLIRLWSFLRVGTNYRSFVFYYLWKPVNPKGNQSWIFIGRTDAEAETPVLWPPYAKNWLTGKDRCWERLKAGGEGDDRGRDDWKASPTWRTWVWASFRSWWWTGKPGVLQSMGLQRVGHDWATELILILMLSSLPHWE